MTRSSVEPGGGTSGRERAWGSGSEGAGAALAGEASGSLGLWRRASAREGCGEPCSRRRRGHPHVEARALPARPAWPSTTVGTAPVGAHWKMLGTDSCASLRRCLGGLAIARAGDRVVVAVVTKTGDTDSVRAGAQALSSLSGADDIAGLPVEARSVPFSSAAALARAATAERFSVLNVTLGFDEAEMGAMAEALDGVSVLSVGAIARYGHPGHRPRQRSRGRKGQAARESRPREAAAGEPELERTRADEDRRMRRLPHRSVALLSAGHVSLASAEDTSDRSVRARGARLTRWPHAFSACVCEHPCPWPRVLQAPQVCAAGQHRREHRTDGEAEREPKRQRGRESASERQSQSVSIALVIGFLIDRASIDSYLFAFARFVSCR